MVKQYSPSLCFPSPALLTAATAFKTTTHTHTHTPCTDIGKKMSRQGARIRRERKEKEVVSVRQREKKRTMGRKVGSTGRENVALGRRLHIVLVVYFSLAL